MDNTTLIIIIVGLLAALAIILIGVLAYFNRKLAEAALAIAGPALLALRNQGEVAIVNSGVDLSFVNDFLLLIQPHVDSPDDTFIANIANLLGVPAVDVAQVAVQIWSEAEDLTDGVIEPETAAPSPVAGAART